MYANFIFFVIPVALAIASGIFEANDAFMLFTLGIIPGVLRQSSMMTKIRRDRLFKTALLPSRMLCTVFLILTAVALALAAGIPPTSPCRRMTLFISRKTRATP